MNYSTLDPNLNGHQLSELASTRPDLWPAILQHPNTHPSLAAWINTQRNYTGAIPTPGKKSHTGLYVALAAAVVVVLAVGAGAFWLINKNDPTPPVASPSAPTTTSVPTTPTPDPDPAPAPDTITQTPSPSPENSGPLGIYADGRPIVVGQSGIEKPTAGAPTVTHYFSYSCPPCVYTDLSIESELNSAIEQGKVTINYQMVNTSAPEWNEAATAAALQIAQHDPKNYLKFNHAVFKYAYEQLESSNHDFLSDADKSVEQIKAIANEIGISADVVSKFDVSAAKQYLEKSTELWTSSQVEGRNGRYGTPEFIRDGKQLNPRAEESVTSFIAKMTD